jgi:hypothetical protein
MPAEGKRRAAKSVFFQAPAAETTAALAAAKKNVFTESVRARC